MRINVDWSSWQRRVWQGAMAMLSCLLATSLQAQALNSSGATVSVMETFQSRATVALVTIAIVIACVVLHYEVLSWLTGWLKRIKLRPRRHILVLIFAILGIHVVEVWVFGGGYYYLITDTRHGALVANHAIGLLDCIYFSAVCFTTLGLGDVIPMGAVRFLTGTEALTGFVLLTWSASFTFMEMERFWRT
jgi:hypothetical protein